MDKYKLKNEFKVHEFIQLVPVDYVFSKNTHDEFYQLLNIEQFGHLAEEMVENLAKTKRVLIINNDTLEMKAYNIPADEVIAALMSL